MRTTGGALALRSLSRPVRRASLALLTTRATAAALFPAMRARAVRITTLALFTHGLPDVELRQRLGGNIPAQQPDDVLQEG